MKKKHVWTLINKSSKLFLNTFKEFTTHSYAKKTFPINCTTNKTVFKYISTSILGLGMSTAFNLSAWPCKL